MKKLIKYIVTEITQNKDFEIEEELEGDHTHYTIKVDEDLVGLVIGKGGKTIRSIRNLVKVRATLEKVSASVSVTQK